MSAFANRQGTSQHEVEKAFMLGRLLRLAGRAGEVSRLCGGVGVAESRGCGCFEIDSACAINFVSLLSRRLAGHLPRRRRPSRAMPDLPAGGARPRFRATFPPGPPPPSRPL